MILHLQGDCDEAVLAFDEAFGAAGDNEELLRFMTPAVYVECLNAVGREADAEALRRRVTN